MSDDQHYNYEQTHLTYYTFKVTTNTARRYFTLRPYQAAVQLVPIIVSRKLCFRFRSPSTVVSDLINIRTTVQHPNK